MSEVEVLLRVDAGEEPEGTRVFRARDPEAPVRKMYGRLALSVVALAVGCALTGAGRTPVALLLLGAGMLGIWSIETDGEDPDERRYKQPTLVVTPTGMIVRDNHGLRTWAFEDLEDVRPFVHDGRVGLLVVEHDGRRDFVDHLLFQRGEDLREILGRHLKPRTT
jgi:hypothetical protein